MTDGTAKPQTVRAFLRDVIDRVFSPDSRTLRTFAVLIRRPGELTRAYFDGIADDFIHPLEVFLLANVCFFVIGGVTHNQMLTTHLDTQLCCEWHSAYARRVVWHEVNNLKVRSWNDATRDSATEISRAEKGTELQQPVAQRTADYLRFQFTFATVMARFEAHYNDASENDARSLVVLMLPLFALVIALLQFRRGTGVQHIVFSLHFYAFALLLYCAMWVPAWVVAILTRGALSDGALGIILFLLQTIYLIIAMGAAYGDRWGGRLRKGLIAGGASVLVLQAYRFLLFLFVFYTVR